MLINNLFPEAVFGFSARWMEKPDCNHTLHLYIPAFIHSDSLGLFLPSKCFEAFTSVISVFLPSLLSIVRLLFKIFEDL